MRSNDLRGEMNQLKALIDLCHVHGLAVLLDVVYNHAGGDFGDESLYFFDRQSTAGGNAEFALLHRPRARRRAGVSISANRRCAISSSRTPNSSLTNIALTDFATIR